MRNLVVIACVLLGAGGQAIAVESSVEAAISTFRQVERDQAKLKAFCEMTSLMSAGDDDLPKDDGVYKRIDADMRTLGPDFQLAWNLGADLEPDTSGQKAYEAAMGALESKCPN